MIQRFGGALNLNVHLHMLLLDGAYTFGGRGVLFIAHAGPAMRSCWSFGWPLAVGGGKSQITALAVVYWAAFKDYKTAAMLFSLKRQ